MKLQKINIIVACDLNGAIGYKNKLLCYLPEDLKFFKETTQKSSVIMGMNTFNSIGKALPNRENIVLTSNPNNYPDLDADDNIILVNNMENAIETASHDKIFIIGGERVYNTILSPCYFDMIDSIYITLINHSFEAYDKIFPKSIVDEYFTPIVLDEFMSGQYKLTFLKYNKHD